MQSLQWLQSIAELQSAWRLFWDQQLLKILNAQFARDIRNLNANLPTQTISLTFTDRQLQFDPSLEDIRAVHYKINLGSFFGLPGQVRLNSGAT
jgi:hypothetical protein